MSRFANVMFAATRRGLVAAKHLRCQPPRGTSGIQRNKIASTAFSFMGHRTPPERIAETEMLLGQSRLHLEEEGRIVERRRLLGSDLTESLTFLETLKSIVRNRERRLASLQHWYEQDVQQRSGAPRRGGGEGAEPSKCCAIVISGRFFTGHSTMNLSDTFRSHAQECQRMASSMRDAADKATWSQMAKRWLAYAEYYEDRHQRSARGPRPATEGRIHV
jgi:hypothetical protein